MANYNAGENGKNTRFRSGNEAAKNGRKGGKKSGETRRWLGDAKKQLNATLTDKEIEDINKVFIERCKKGNLTAIKMLYDYTSREDEQSNEVKIVIAKDDYDAWSV